MEPFFVDCHSHVVPSGDDGAPSVRDGVALCREAARRGTAVLFATPHVWPQLPLSAAREEDVRAAYAQIRPHAGLELRLGFELTPARALLEEDPRRYALQGTRGVLMEVPFSGAADLLVALAEHVEAAGLRPVIAHPERSQAVQERPALADELGERFSLQVNASSLLGRHGEHAERIGWGLLERGRARLVASDGHRPARPVRVDEAWQLACARLGAGRARPLFDGSGLGVTAPAPALPARAASRAS